MYKSDDTFNCLILVYCLQICIRILNAEKGFCYMKPECGPSSPLWPPKCKTEVNQSPISLEWVSATEPNRVSVSMNKFLVKEFLIKNVGFTAEVEVTFDGEEEEAMTYFPGENGKGLLETRYTLKGFHFHWGPDRWTGSEHYLDGKPYPMEMHLVHYDSKYSDLAEAIESKAPGVLAVVSFLMKIVEKNEPASKLMERIVPLLSGIKEYSNKSSTLVEEKLDLFELVPQHRDEFYSYVGSTTSPGCIENVNWFVFRRKIPIHEEMVDKFRKLIDHNGDFIKSNHRPLQFRDSREVKMNVVVATDFLD